MSAIRQTPGIILATGKFTLLMQSAGWKPQISPRGDGVIVFGHELRLFSSDGDLLRTIAPPEGMSIWDARWSPDGSRFAYVMAPKP